MFLLAQDKSVWLQREDKEQSGSIPFFSLSLSILIKVFGSLLKGGSSQNSWQPVMTVDTTTSDYWLNWRVLVCSIWVFSSMAAASALIWKYEGFHCNKDERREARREAASSLYEDECWKPCLKEIHPAWLLAYRIFAFIVLLTLLIINVVVDGGSIFYYYTQWTFTLVTIYFGFGFLLSIHGCQRYLSNIRGEKVEQARVDTEHGTYVPPTHAEGKDLCNPTKSSALLEENHVRKMAGVWGHSFQIIYQTCAGAVMLTDFVFWLIIFPFLTMRDNNLSFLLVGMHSINALFLLGDAALNSLQFPWFRLSYFILWTAIYVIFQWVIHASVSLWWPYPFLDLSSPHAPVWYMLVALLHIPCYAFFALFIKMKHFLLSKWFAQSY